MSKQKRPGTPDEQIEQLLIELKVCGFAVAKEIASLRGMTSGNMKCPLCKKELRFRTALSNNHFSAKCETPDCINMME